MSFDNFNNFNWDSPNINSIETTKKKFEKDTRYWSISSDEQGLGSAIIRLLPDPTNLFYVQRYEYALRKPIPGGKPKWYIANSRETLQQPDPAKQHFDKLKAEGTVEAENESKKFSRATKYITNIMVINDPADPKNNGKIFLFKMGSKLKSKIEGWMKPTPNELSMGTVPKAFWNPLAEGRDLLLKVKPLGGIPNYDDTEYMDKRAMFNDRESAIQYITTNCYDLRENVLSEKEFDSYEDLKKRFDNFMGSGAPAVVTPVAPTIPVPTMGMPGMPVESYNMTAPTPTPAPVMVQPMVQPVVQPTVQPTVQPIQPGVVMPQVQQTVQQVVQPMVQPMQSTTQPTMAMPQTAAADDWMSEIE